MTNTNFKNTREEVQVLIHLRKQPGWPGSGPVEPKAWPLTGMRGERGTTQETHIDEPNQEDSSCSTGQLQRNNA